MRFKPSRKKPDGFVERIFSCSVVWLEDTKEWCMFERVYRKLHHGCETNYYTYYSNNPTPKEKDDE